MLIPRIKRGIPDVVYVIVRNDDTVTMVNGDVLIWQTAASKNYGVDALTSPNTAGLVTVAGVLSGPDVVVNDYGTCQVYGYHSSVKSGTSTAGVEQKTVATAKTAGDGAAADSPGAFMGVCLKATASGRAGIMLRLM